MLFTSHMVMVKSGRFEKNHFEYKLILKYVIVQGKTDI